MNSVRLADYIAQRCVDFGAKDVFLVTGGGAMHLNDAFARNKNLRVTCFHHEQAAAMAAEAYFRYSGQIAILNVTTGPGGINALNGVYGAYVDSMAMLVISGQVKRETYAGCYALPLRQLGDQEVDIISVSRPLIKYGVLLLDPLSVRKIVDKALFIAMSGRPGPVWIDIPVDVQSQLIDPTSLEGWDGNLEDLLSDPGVTPNTRAEIESRLQTSDLNARAQEIIAKFLSSKRPVLFLGNGVRLAGVTKKILDFAQRSGVPVVTGWNAHDLIPNDHPCFSGRPGTVGDRAGNYTVQNADFLLVLGCRLNIRQVSYNYKSFASKAWKAIVDIDPTELRKPTLSFDATLCECLTRFWPVFEGLLPNMCLPNPEHRVYLNWCRERVRGYPVVLPEYRYRNDLLNPYVFVEELFALLPEDSAVIAGNGSACVIGFQAASLKPGQRFFTNSGCASMGYDLPAAIGVSLAKGSSVFCLAGDGSLMMNIQELQTVVGYGLPIKIMVLNNNGYLSIKQTQQAYFPDNIFGISPCTGVSFPNFVEISKAFGIEALKVDSLETLRSPEIQAILLSAQPALIDVHVDTSQVFAPKLASRKLADGSMISPSLEDMAPFLSVEEARQNTITD